MVTTPYDFGGARALVIQADGKIVAAGSSGSMYYAGDYVLARFNPNGTLDTGFGTDGLVTTDINSGSDDYANAVTIQADGKIVLAGLTNDAFSRPWGYDFAIVRYHGVGISSPELIALLLDDIQELVEMGDLNNGNGNALLVKLQAAIQQLDKDNYIAAANQIEAFINQVEAFVATGTLTSEEGQSLIATAEEAISYLGKRAGEVASEELTPSQYQLAQNYPNPFNPTTSISYQLTTVSDQPAHYTTLKIYNVLGQEVRTLVNEVKDPGFYTVIWDGRNS